MKYRGFEFSIGRPSLGFIALLKFVLLLSLLVMFSNVTLSLYSSVSYRYYTTINLPFLNISSSSDQYLVLPSYNYSDSTQSSLYHSSSMELDKPSSSQYLLLPAYNYSNSTQSSLYHSNSMELDKPSSSRYMVIPSYNYSNSTQSSLYHSNSMELDKPSSSQYMVLPSYNYSNSTQSSLYHSNSMELDKLSSSLDHSKLNSSATNSGLESEKRAVVIRKGLPKGCDLSKGEWVREEKAPYYTNATCWMIQEHQNCIKYGRPNLDFLKWRWKPDGCDLPILDPALFLQLMTGKSLAFIGDSLARNQMQSLLCLLSQVEFPKEMSLPTEGNVTVMFYPNHNFTIGFIWSPFLIRAEQSNHTVYNFSAWNLYLDEPDPVWPAHLQNFHYIVVNTGNWYTRPSLFHLNRALVGCHFCAIPNIPFMSIRRAHRRAFRTALDAISDNRHGFRGMTVVRTVSPAHFEGGEWNKGGDCSRTGPFRRSEAPRLEGVEKEMYREQLKEFWKAKWEGSERGFEFRLLDATTAMLMRPDGHPSRYGHWPNEDRVMYNDCVHWCLPGPVDMWNDFLLMILTI